MERSDILILNGKVITSDPLKPTAGAIAVKGDKIVFVGSNVEASEWVGGAKRVIDARNGTVLPGFIDSHLHLRAGSIELENAELSNINSIEELDTVLKKYALENPDETWIKGSNLHYEIFPGDNNKRLDRHILDSIISDRPVAVMAYDHHTLWVNTLALKLTDLYRGAKTGPNSAIVLDKAGIAIGEVQEPDAYMRVLKHTGAWGRSLGTLAGLSSEQIGVSEIEDEKRAIIRGAKLLAKSGITSVHNMDGDHEQAKTYFELSESEELPIRVYAPFTINPDTKVKDLEEAVEMRAKFNNSWVHAGSIKIFMDGVIEAWTALLTEDYANRIGSIGSAMFEPDHFNMIACAADELELQLITHAIGDAAVRRTLDGYEAALTKNGKRDSRHRIEHIELVHPDDISRFSDLGVIASMQPFHRGTESDSVWNNNIPRKRWKDAFAWQTIRNSGTPLIFGSDWPVVTYNPMWELKAAMGYKPWTSDMPDQTQKLSDVINSYTRLAAYAEFKELEKGQLRIGALADIVVMSADLEYHEPNELINLHPVMTICGGRIVFEE